MTQKDGLLFRGARIVGRAGRDVNDSWPEQIRMTSNSTREEPGQLRDSRHDGVQKRTIEFVYDGVSRVIWHSKGDATLLPHRLDADKVGDSFELQGVTRCAIVTNSIFFVATAEGGVDVLEVMGNQQIPEA